MRSARTTAVLLAAAVSILLAASSASAPEARKKIDYMDKPVPEWRQGPVRYIITKWEDNEYKSLKTEEERTRFIEEFWQRRDTTPDTPGNEFRAEFWKRVRDANRLYGENVAKPGWRTDMGKIHILRGPPDDITRDLVAEGNRGTVVWTYRNSGGIPGIGPNVVIAFARDVTGEFRLSSEPTKDADVRQGGIIAYQPPMGTTAMIKTQQLLAKERAERLVNLSDPLIRQAGGPVTSTPLDLYTQLAKLQQPPAEWEIQETVTTQEFFGAVPMHARADFFRTTTSKTLVVLTTGVKSSAVHYRRVGNRDAPDVLFYARILDLTGNDLVASLEQDDDFAPARENRNVDLDGDLMFQGRVLLDPGSYKASMTVLDRAGGRAGSYTFPITVPDFGSGDLTLSSIMLARSIDRVQTGSQTGGGVTPYVLGNLRVLPRLGQDFTPDDTLAFYYQVYNAATDPATGKPDLDVDYGFYTLTPESSLDLGHVSFEDQHEEVHGYTLSLKDWPQGPYMVRVAVTDKVAKATTSRDLVFQLR